jgi:hypothetical protein
MIDVCTKKKLELQNPPQITLQNICWVRYPPITLKVSKFELAIKGKVINMMSLLVCVQVLGTYLLSNLFYLKYIFTLLSPYKLVST